VVLARDGRILVQGYNGAPAGMPHCEHPDGEVSVSGSKGCEIAVHAEANAIAYAARLGIRLEGAEMYTTLSPCVACAMLIINAGITCVYAAQIYRDLAGVELLSSGGIDVVSLTP
jgi:dCMP deaminase